MGGVAAGQSLPQPTFRHVELVIDPDGRGSITVDGVDLSLAVNAVEIQSQVGDTTRMTLSLVAPRIEFDGQATIDVRHPMRDALIALGWIPPGQGQWLV